MLSTGQPLSVTKISRLALDIIIYLAIILLVIFLLSELNIGPLRIKYIQSGSMAPSINVGDLVILNRAQSGAIQPGDVIYFTNSDDLEVVHRVEEINNGCITTRGDANNAPDAGCATNVSGKVILAIPWLGYLFGFIKSGIYGLLHLIR